MDVRNVQIWVADGLLFAQTAVYAYIFWKQRKTIQKQSAVLSEADRALRKVSGILRAIKEEKDVRAALPTGGHISIGMMHDEGKHFAVITYPNGESFQGPERDTEEQAAADIMKKKEELFEACGGKIKQVFGPDMGPVH